MAGIPGLPFVAPIGLSLLGTAILDLTGLGDAPAVRSIAPGMAGGDIRAQVTIEEDGDDELEITQHPVENGAAISDHAYKRPPEVRLRVGWTQSYSGGGSIVSAYLGTWSGIASPPLQQIYEQIVKLQEKRQPFTVVTGKRSYENMLVASIRVHNDAKFEHSLIADITFRKVILVSTQTIKGAVPTNEGQLADPKSNMPTADQGQRQTTPAPISSAKIVASGGIAPEGGPFGPNLPSTFGGGGTISPVPEPGNPPLNPPTRAAGARMAAR